MIQVDFAVRAFRVPIRPLLDAINVEDVSLRAAELADIGRALHVLGAKHATMDRHELLRQRDTLFLSFLSGLLDVASKLGQGLLLRVVHISGARADRDTEGEEAAA